MLRILIADDHPVCRQGLKQIVCDDFGEVVLGEAGTGSEALKLVQKQAWDVVLLDLNLPDKHGLDVLKSLKTLYPKIPVLVMSIYPEDQYAVRVLKAGGAGYLTKESAPEELTKAVHKALQGGKYVSSTLAEHMALDLTTEISADLHQQLSDREYQVLCLLGQGKSASEISDELALSVKTVSTYRARLLEKLKLKTTADLIRYTIEHHLLG